MEMQQPLLSVQGLCRHYPTFSLTDISFELLPGFIMGYIGPNGAGKTTTLNAIAHLARQTEGEIRIDGISFSDDPILYRSMIGYIGDASYFPKEMTCRDIRSVLKDFYPTFRPEVYAAYLEKWELPEKKRMDTFSRGMKVKLMFAAVLARKTRLLILDEATNGLDPLMRRDILLILQEYIADGKNSILFSTHIMEDLQDIADYIFFIDHGKKVLFETKDELLEKYLLIRGGTEELTPELKEQLIGIRENAYGFSALFATDDGGVLPASLSAERPQIDQIMVHMLSEGRRA